MKKYTYKELTELYRTAMYDLDDRFYDVNDVDAEMLNQGRLYDSKRHKFLDVIKALEDQTDNFDSLCDCDMDLRSIYEDKYGHRDDCMTVKIRRDVGDYDEV